MAATSNSQCFCMPKLAANTSCSCSQCSSLVSQNLLPSTEEILMTHGCETLEFDLTPLVKVIDTIFQNAAVASSKCPPYATLSDTIWGLETYGGMRQALDDMRSISYEMSCYPMRSIDATTMVVLKMLKNYSWNAKTVIAIASIASSIGELSMLVNYRSSDLMARSVDLLKCHPLKLDLTVLNNLTRALMDVVNTNLAFLVPPISKISKAAPSMMDAMGYFPIATYKTIRIVAQIASILSKRSEENIDLTIRSLAMDLCNIHTVLQEKLERCRRELFTVQCQPLEQSVWSQCNIVQSAYEDYLELIPKISIWELNDKMKYNTKIQVPERLRNKHVLFLISDLDISTEEIKFLNRLYLKSNQRYEIVWLPIVDNISTYDRTKFSCLKQLINWGTVDPSKIGPGVIEYVKKEWNFVKDPIAVSLIGGEVTCQNALPMLWIWGNLAFPFTEIRERELWCNINEATGWKLDLLIDENIVPDICSWSGSFVCLFGGDNMSWICDLIEKVRMATNAAGVCSTKLVYVGKSKSKGLASYELGPGIYVLEGENRWQFWSRLESILYAKLRQGKSSKTDCITREAMKVLGYAGNGEPWAMFSMGPAPMVTTNGEMALTIMSKYRDWNMMNTTSIAGPCNFIEALRNYYMMIQSRSCNLHGCLNVHLPILGQLPGNTICPECCKEMEMCYTYRCSV